MPPERLDSDAADAQIGLRVTMGQLTSSQRSRQEAGEEIAAERKLPVAAILDSPFSLVGDKTAIRDRVVELAEAYGATYFTVSEDFGWDMAGMVGELSG